MKMSRPLTTAEHGLRAYQGIFLLLYCPVLWLGAPPHPLLFLGFPLIMMYFYSSAIAWWYGRTS